MKIVKNLNYTIVIIIFILIILVFLGIQALLEKKDVKEITESLSIENNSFETRIDYSDKSNPVIYVDLKSAEGESEFNKWLNEQEDVPSNLEVFFMASTGGDKGVVEEESQ
jgi:hypothetical protein